MANLQIKGMDDNLYKQLRKLAVAENRSISQEVVYLLKLYLGRKAKIDNLPTPAEKLIELSGSWQGEEKPEELASTIRKARKNSRKLTKGF